MGRTVNVLTGVAGLNSKMHPVRLYRGQNGVVELAEAVNIDISDRQKPKRRKGQLSTSISSPVHSLYNAGSFVLCISGSTLYRFGSSFSLSVVRTGLTSKAEVSYAELADKIFYTNGYENGYVDTDGTHHAWVASIDQYKAVDSSRKFSNPPIGHLLVAFGSRVFIAQDNILWFTEPFAPLLVDMARNAIPFMTRIKAMAPVADGLFVSTSKKIIFLKGVRTDGMVTISVAPYPIISGTVVYAQADEVIGLSEAEIYGEVAIVTTSKGVCVCGPGGFFQNFTRRKIDMPAVSSGSAYIYNGKYVVSLKS